MKVDRCKLCGRIHAWDDYKWDPVNGYTIERCEGMTSPDRLCGVVRAPNAAIFTIEFSEEELVLIFRALNNPDFRLRENEKTMEFVASLIDGLKDFKAISKGFDSRSRSIKYRPSFNREELNVIIVVLQHPHPDLKKEKGEEISLLLDDLTRIY